MLIYFDCEFTDLYDDTCPFKLISAGFVTFDGLEFYFELIDSYIQDDCSLFVQSEVLPHLNTIKYGMTSFAAAQALQEWVESLSFDDLALASDAPNYDFKLIQDLLRGHDCWPNNLSKKEIDLIAVFKNIQIDTRIDEFFKFNSMAIRHHALWDARALANACIKKI